MSKRKKLKRKVNELEQQSDQMFEIICKLTSTIQHLKATVEALPVQFGEAFGERFATDAAVIERQTAVRNGQSTNH